MSKTKWKSAWSTNDDKDEIYVSALMGALLRVASVLGAAPARLRRARDADDAWKLAVSPPLAKLQRLIAAISSILLIVFMVLVPLERSKTPQTEDPGITGMLSFCEIVLIMLLYGYGVWTALRRLTLLTSVLRQLQKVKTSLFWQPSVMESEGLSVKLLYLYIVWQTFTCAEDVVWTQSLENLNYIQWMITARYYQYLIVQFLLLQWGIMILGIKSTLALLNDQLEQLLLTSSTSSTNVKVKLYLKELVPHNVKISTQYMQEFEEDKEPEFDKERIHHLKYHHGRICDLVFQVDQEYGPLILLSFMVLFIHLLITPQNLIIEMGTSVLTYIVVLRQLNWLAVHLCQLILLVEPCHRLQDQMERTRSLISKMVGRSERFSDPAQLDLFVLQVRMRNDTIVPMGMFTIARPLLVSVLGAVVTYFIIVFQIQASS